MTASGIYSLGDIVLTTADTYVGDWLEDLDGIHAFTAQLRLVYGSGGTSGKVYLQTSLDDDTAVDIACMTFLVAAKTQVFNFSGLTPKLTPITPADGALSDDTAIDGVIGTRLRLKIVTLGTYAGSTQIAGRVVVR